MTYTVFDTSSAQPDGIVVPTVMDALKLARELGRRGDQEPVVAAENGWMLTLDELEALAQS